MTEEQMKNTYGMRPLSLGELVKHGDVFWDGRIVVCDGGYTVGEGNSPHYRPISPGVGYRLVGWDEAVLPTDETNQRHSFDKWESSSWHNIQCNLGTVWTVAKAVAIWQGYDTEPRSVCVFRRPLSTPSQGWTRVVDNEERDATRPCYITNGIMVLWVAGGSVWIGKDWTHWRYAEPTPLPPVDEDGEAFEKWFNSGEGTCITYKTCWQSALAHARKGGGM